ncbi:MAG: radical SAM protein, partial [Phycisphaerales bacterium]
SSPARRSADRRVGGIRGKVERGERLSLADGEVLFETGDVWGVIELADLVRNRLHPGVGYYNINRHMNYSNVCALSCKFCEFYRKKDDDGAYTRDEGYVRAQAREAVENGATEMHIVGGLHPYLPWEYYPSMLRAIKDEAPGLHIKAFTAVEIVHLAKIAKKWKGSAGTDRREGIRWVLSELKAAGLGSLPGGGAEVFDDRVHDQAYKGKIRSDVWLDVHRVAHELGLNSNCTILYGHIEQRRERLVHMDMLRRAQDVALARLGYEAVKGGGEEGAGREVTGRRPVPPGEGDGGGQFGGYGVDASEWPGAVTLSRAGVELPGVVAARKRAAGDAEVGGYFQCIIPLPFFPDGSELEHLAGPSGLENLRTLAVARLMLDNFPHVKAFWIMQTLKMAQLQLRAGADDIDGTVVWYDITKVGGASTHQETTVWDLQKAIREAGYEPVERDTLYRRVVREGREWRVEEK